MCVCKFLKTIVDIVEYRLIRIVCSFVNYAALLAVGVGHVLWRPSN